MASTIATPERPVEAIRMSWEEFLAHDFEGIAEWVDGEVQIDMSVGRAHAVVSRFLIQFLQQFCRVTHLGEVFAEPFAMRVALTAPGREPDITVVRTENLGRLTEQFLDGPADLVIEVVSPESISRDRDEKFHEYEAGGVPEYWIIDPRAGFERADFFVLAADPARPGRNAYRPVPIADDGTYRSAALPGLWLRVSWLWQADAEPLKCLAEVLGRERVLTLLD